MKRAPPYLLALVSLLFARASLAQTAPWSEPSDHVDLRDGTHLDGRAVDVRVGDQLTLRLPSGELRVILWPEVLRASGGSFDASGASAALAANGAATVAPAWAVATEAAPGSGAPGSGAATPTTTSTATSTATSSAATASSAATGGGPPPLLTPAEHPPPPPGAEARAAQSRPLDTIDRYLTPRAGTVPVQLVADGEPLTLSALVELPLGSAPPTDPFLEPNLGGTPAIDANAVAMRDALGLPVRTEYLCTTPCMLYLPPGRARLHLGGSGRLESIEAIDVGRAPQRVTLFSPSAAAFGGGVALTLLGASSALVGGMALIVDLTSSTNASTSLATAGGIMLGLGGASLAVGIPLILRARTGVERTTRLPVRPSSAASRDEGSSARARPGTPPLVGASLVPLPHGQGVVAGLAFTF